jgi:hypothetical protein
MAGARSPEFILVFALLRLAGRRLMKMSASVRTLPSNFEGQKDETLNEVDFKPIEFLQNQGYSFGEAKEIINVAGIEQVKPAMEWLLNARDQLMQSGLPFKSAEAILATSIRVALKWNRHSFYIVRAFEYYTDDFAPLWEFGNERAARVIRGMLVMLIFGLPLPLQGKVENHSSARLFLLQFC